jgi:hypothetical protein
MEVKRTRLDLLRKIFAFTEKMKRVFERILNDLKGSERFLDPGNNRKP